MLFGSSLIKKQNKKETLSDLDPLWQNLLDPCMKPLILNYYMFLQTLECDFMEKLLTTIVGNNELSLDIELLYVFTDTRMRFHGEIVDFGDDLSPRSGFYSDSFHILWEYYYTIDTNSLISRHPNKGAYWKTIFFISHPKHMLCVLKRTVSIRRFS